MYHLTPIFYILLGETGDFCPFGFLRSVGAQASKLGVRRFPVWRGCSLKCRGIVEIGLLILLR